MSGSLRNMNGPHRARANLGTGAARPADPEVYRLARRAAKRHTHLVGARAFSHDYIIESFGGGGGKGWVGRGVGWCVFEAVGWYIFEGGGGYLFEGGEGDTFLRGAVRFLGGRYFF